MISANTKIIREDNVHGVHDVFFSPKTIEKIQKKFTLQGFSDNVNKMHDASQIVDGAKMLYNYIIGGEKNPKAPEAFKKLNLQDGSWIASYFIEDDVLWDQVKSGKFQGFSVEGYFNRNKIETKTKNKMKKKSIFEMMFGAKPEVKKSDKFEAIETVDGAVLNYEGELNVDSVLTMENEEVKKEVAEVMRKIVEDSDERFKAVEAANVELTAKNEKLESFVAKLTDSEGGKFNSQAKKTGANEKKSRREILKENK